MYIFTKKKKKKKKRKKEKRLACFFSFLLFWFCGITDNSDDVIPIEKHVNLILFLFSHIYEIFLMDICVYKSLKVLHLYIYIYTYDIVCVFFLM